MTDRGVSDADDALGAIGGGGGLAHRAARSASRWELELTHSDALLRLSGSWIARETGVPTQASVQALVARMTGATALRLDTALLTRWDSALIAFLEMLEQEALARPGSPLEVDLFGLPRAARQLVMLARSQWARLAPRPLAASPSPVARLGEAVLGVYRHALAVVSLVGETALRALAALTGRVQTRATDVIELMQDAGASALGIVAVVNGLVGAILAFVAVVELQRFGAEIYVADLVGIGMVREMGPVMTAIVMAGRTGSAYAAQLATMQGNEEIDALKAFGISIHDFLVLPRILALLSMMPLLFLYACAIGVLGGGVVAVTALHVTPSGYVEELRNALSGTQFALGLTKSMAFGALIALAGCEIGLSAGRSAADTGRAATRAVVAGIVGVIAVDALFALCANVLGV